jgi:hypothetical protein
MAKVPSVRINGDHIIPWVTSKGEEWKASADEASGAPKGGRKCSQLPRTTAAETAVHLAVEEAGVHLCRRRSGKRLMQ